MTASDSVLTPVLGSLYALQVPIPYPMKTVTVLLDTPRGGPLSMVDCALDTPEARQAIEDGLSALKRHWSDVDRLIITHHHPDHYGLAGIVEERSGANVQMLDVEIGRGERYWHLWEEWLPGHLKHMRDHGLPPASGISPTFENAWTKRADFAASTMSQPKAMFAPAPAATPFTAQTTGFGIARRRRTSGL